MHKNHIHIRSKKNIGNELLWKFRSAFLWHAIEFRDFREYSETDDAKYIDWVASSKEQALIMRRYQEERESTLHLVIDESESTSENYDDEKYILKNTLIELISQACIQSNIQYTWWRKWKYKIVQEVHKNPYITERRLLQKFSEIPRWEDIFSLREFVRRKKKKSIYIIISDSLYFEEKSLKALAMLHDVIFLHVSSSFENTLSWTWVHAISWKYNLYIDLDNKQKKEMYVIKRKQQLNDFKKKLRSFNIRVWFFETWCNIKLELIKTLDTH